MSDAHGKNTKYELTLALGALGVVYGDIGTSPLYALRECFHAHHGVPPTPQNVLGVLSLVVWSLIIIISIKYLVLVMRADNRGEGGILALMALVRSRGGILVALGLFGAALLYGDGMITPAISVLSAIEGLEIATPVFAHFVVPLTVIVLIALFAVQRYGTGKVGSMFGPVMLVWFVAIAALGVLQIVHAPYVLTAFNPLHAVTFFRDNHLRGFLVLGAVFLCVTGGEALYADMGHFGARPIRIAWFTVVFPSLLINYFGQGALLLRDPRGIDNPFFLMGPSWTRFPLIALATVATVIASQAVISGAFSLTRQAVQLGYMPRIVIKHTSIREIGQIYIPSVNWILMICAIALVLAFQASSALAAAYGVAVTTTMGITTALIAIVERQRWHWSVLAVIAVTVPLLAIDLAFFGANIVKVAEGGWFPLAVGLGIFTLMSTWSLGRKILAQRVAAKMSVEEFMHAVESKELPRVPGTAIFLSRYPKGVPTALVQNLQHNKVVHEHVILLSVGVEETPHVADDHRMEWITLGKGVYRAQMHFGFTEEPNLPAALATGKPPLPLDPAQVSYFLGRDTIIATRMPGMAIWRERLFGWMMRNSSGAAQYFCLPAGQVIELGAQVEI